MLEELKKELNENDLKNITGGKFDVELFGEKFIDALTKTTEVLTVEHKQLVEAIKNKRWTDVNILITQLLGKKDPLVTKIYLECM